MATYKIHCNAPLFFLLRMLVNTCEKENLKFVYTFNHIVVNQAILYVVEPTTGVQCNLVYPDLLETSKYINTHVQRVWSMIF